MSANPSVWPTLAKLEASSAARVAAAAVQLLPLSLNGNTAPDSAPSTVTRHGMAAADAAFDSSAADSSADTTAQVDDGRWQTWIPDPPAAVNKSGMSLPDGSELRFKEPNVKDAMFRMGITKEELQEKPLKSFEARGKMNGVVYSASSVRELRWKRAEQLRQKTITRLLAEIVRAEEEEAARGDVVDDYASRGDTAVAMLAEQGKMLLAQEEAKAKATAESTAARAAAEKQLAEEAEALKEANRIKQAKILEKFEKEKAEFEATGACCRHLLARRYSYCCCYWPRRRRRRRRHHRHSRWRKLAEWFFLSCAEPVR